MLTATLQLAEWVATAATVIVHRKVTKRYIMTETKYKTLIDEESMACGHPDSFEHRLINALFDAYEMGYLVNQDPTGSCIEFVQGLFAHYGMKSPTIEEMLANPYSPFKKYKIDEVN
jgi:hypothetical protein